MIALALLLTDTGSNESAVAARMRYYLKTHTVCGITNNSSTTHLGRGLVLWRITHVNMFDVHWIAAIPEQLSKTSDIRRKSTIRRPNGFPAAQPLSWVSPEIVHDDTWRDHRRDGLQQEDRSWNMTIDLFSSNCANSCCVRRVISRRVLHVTSVLLLFIQCN